MTDHALPLSNFDYYYLARGDKDFITIREPFPGPGIRYGDVLRLTNKATGTTLVRHVVYAETGIQYAQGYICIKLAAPEEPAP